MKTIFYAILIVILILLSGALSADDISTLDDIRLMALENSLEYRQALLDAGTAERDLTPLPDFEKTRFSYSREYDGDTGLWDSSASFDVPFLDQLSFNGVYNDDNTIQGGVIFSPLTHSDERDQQKITYRKALALVGETAIQAENSALSAVLNWVSATRTLELQESLVAVKESLYRDEKIRYQAGEAFLDDVRAALIDWTDARTTLGNYQAELRQAESELTTALGLSEGAIDLPSVEIPDLERELSLLKLSLFPENTDPSGSYTVLAAQLEVQSRQAELDNTWLFSPDLSLGASITYNEGETGWDASLTFSFSPEDWQSSERKSLESELELQKQEARQVLWQNELSLKQALSALDTTARSTELARLEMDQSRELYDEARFLFDLGEYSRAELEDAALSYETSRLGLFRALADEYLAWREILLYASEE